MTPTLKEFITECLDVLTAPIGGNIRDLVRASGRSIDTVRGVLEHAIPEGNIFSRGPAKYCRYYLNEEDANAGELLRLAAAEIARAQAKEDRKRKEREAYAAAHPELIAKRLARIADADARRAAKAKAKREYRAKVKKTRNPPKLKAVGIVADPRKTAIQRFVASEAVNPNNVPVTRLPTPKPRFHCEAPSDGFASMGIGRYAA